MQTSKTLNYLDHYLTGPYYFSFVCIWIYLRHYLNLRILFSLFTDYKTIGPYELDWETEQYKCSLSFAITLGLLASLQALNLFWLFFILRIAYRFVVHNVAKDDRSDAEESEMEDTADAAKSSAVQDKGKPAKSVTYADVAASGTSATKKTR